MTNRRDFIALTAAAGASLALADWVSAAGGDAADERFWSRVRRAYALDGNIINLDHGWTNPTTRDALDQLERGARELESLPADRLMRFWEEITNTTVRQALAEAMGVPPAELALVRNATEALDTVLLGVPLAAGDEIVCSVHDYYAMLDALEQRQARDGVVLRMVRPPVPAPSFDAIAAVYEEAIGPKTRLVLLTHPSNLTGQLLPVRRIAAAAHRVGAEVVVDGAQSLGLLTDPVTALDCDYYGASAHKWLGAPVGMGMLWMRPEHAAKVWPLVPSPRNVTGMARFEWIGTGPEYVGPAVIPALALHRSIGADRKARRLRDLNRHWRAKVAAALPDARFYTGEDESMSCGLCVVEIPGADHPAIQRQLLEEDRILVQAMSGPHASEIDGLRVTPNVYTSTKELDRFVKALVTRTSPSASRP